MGVVMCVNGTQTPLIYVIANRKKYQCRDGPESKNIPSFQWVYHNTTIT